MAEFNDGYLPPSIQKSMDQHLQRMPANLQKYQSGSSYIPPQAAKAMESYMKKSMPAHMQGYIGAYMEKKEIAGLHSLDPATVRTVQPRAPVPNLMRRDHSAFGEQFSVDASSNNPAQAHTKLSFSPQFSSQSNNAQAPPAPPPAPLPNGSQGQYDFIMNPNNAPKRGLGNSSQTQRILMVVGGGVFALVIVIVLFSVVFKSSGGAVVQLTDIAEQQSEIARVADIGVVKGTSTATKNFAHTTKLTMLSGQQETLALLNKSGHKLGEKQLALKTNPSTTQELDAASANSTFDTTFTRVMHDELVSYRTSLQTYYGTATSNNEKVLLQDSFSSVTLLVGDNQSF